MRFLTQFVVSAFFVAQAAFALDPARSASAPAATSVDFASDRDAILAQIPSISTSGSVGDIVPYGPNAFAIVAGKDGESLQAVVAGARWEKGRIVAFAHDGFLNPKSDAGAAQMLVNAARWAIGGAGKGRIAVHRQPELLAHLKSAGFQAEAADGANWAEKLAGFRGLAVNAHDIGEKDVASIARWVRGGGGLVTAATGWGWQSLNADKKIATDFPGNQLLAPSGLIWGTATVDATSEKAGFLTNVSGAELALLDASAALDALIGHVQGKAPLDASKIGQIGATLSAASRSLPPDDQTILPQLHSIGKLPGGAEIPRPDKPLPASNPIARIVVSSETELLKTARPEQIRAHPAAEFFPGAVPTNAIRQRNRAVGIDLGTPGWHGTGLYAAPGELITVVVPPGMADKGLGIRIGCHSDDIWQHEEWRRFPEISRVDPIHQIETRTANSFGGLVYIVVPDKLPSGKIIVSVTGAVESPRFVLGETKLLDWKMRIRAAPGPWAELETSKVIFSVPSEKIRQLDDPEALLKQWDKILDAEADLATIPHERERPERIVVDTQISVGYMHSGYPIMTPLDGSTDQALTLAKLLTGSWGHFHELGHNHQIDDWTFDGTVEVTCNLFSLYVCETICGIAPGEGHVAMKPAEKMKRLRTYLSSSDKFTRWKSDPFLALTMYDELRAGFGWDTYKKVFAEYRNLPKEQRPKTDDEKRDQWMVRFSQAAGRNLGPFFDAWGVPTSTAARDSIKSLPSWMPPDWPKS